MSNIKFVSHHYFPDDLYTREVVYISVDDKFSFAYVSRKTKNGDYFWATPSVSLSKDGAKVYLASFLLDSSFLDREIKAFLALRPWETVQPVTQAQTPKVTVNKSTFFDEECPF